MKSFFKSAGKLMYIMDYTQKVLSVILFALTAFGSVLECVGVSVIIPVVSLIVSPGELNNSAIVKLLPWLAKIEYHQQVALIIASVVILYLFKNGYYIFLSWYRNKYACKIQRDLAVTMMKSYMSRGYEFFLGRNYGELTRGVSNDVNGVYAVVTFFFHLLSDVLTIILIAIFLVITDWQLTMALGAIAIICVGIIFLLFRKKMYDLGQQRRKLNARTNQVILQCFQGVKDVLVLRKQKHFVREHEDALISQQKIMVTISVSNDSPSYIIEGLCVSGIMIAIGVRIMLNTDTTELVTSLAALAVGAFRILPYLGKVTSEVNGLMQNKASVDAIYDDIREAREFAKENPQYDFDKIVEADKYNEDNQFKDCIELKNICFAYGGKNVESKTIFNDLNLKIEKGKSVAFIGPTGAGKSTLIDIILGLLLPCQGEVLMDGENINNIPNKWANVVGYVPQTIFLCDGSIKENVAFGESKESIDEERVIDSLKRADLWDYIQEHPDGIETHVGDRGVRLSGGQRQRVAIARALYHNPEILVLDEATSALDNETEAVIMEAMESLYGQVTMIIVAHRLTTVKKCDVIYEIKDGYVREKNKKEVFES